MKLDDILALVRAGFTREEISTMASGGRETRNNIEQQEKSQVLEEPKIDNNTRELTQVMEEKFNEIMRFMRMSNIQNSSQAEEMKADDVIASILMPNKRGENDGK